MGTEPRPDLRPQTLGGRVGRWHRLVMRRRLYPWNQHVADVLGELDPDTGLRHYDAGLIMTPRQMGKSWWVRADMLAESRRPELVLERGLWVPRPEIPRRIVAYTAQDRGKAAEQIVTELITEQLERCAPLAGRFTARKSNGSERFTWRDTGGRVQVESSNETAGHSLTLDKAVLDEAFAHSDLTIVNAFEPTMLTKPDPQTLVTSAPGDGTDGLLLHYEEIAVIALNDPDTTFAVFVWGATEDDDRADPAVWRRVMPAFDQIPNMERRVRGLLSRTPPAQFDRAYLARRPTAATSAALNLADWIECRNLAATTDPIDPAGGITVALEIDPERTYGSLLIACEGPTSGTVGVICRREPGTRWLAAAVADLVERAGVTVVDVWADRRSGLGGVIDELIGRGITPHEVSAGDVASAAGTLFDLVGAHEIVHDDQVDLNDAVTGSRRRPLGEAWTFSKLTSVGDVAPAAGAALAVAAFRQHFPRGVNLTGPR